MSRTALNDAVAGFARQVRSHLADLGPEIVEDLTDGLEADLAEALADLRAPAPTTHLAPTTFLGRPEDAEDADAAAPSSSGMPDAATSDADLVARFGTPAAYAAELQSAAGIAPARPRGGRWPRRRADALGSVRSWALRGASPVTSASWWPSLRDFLVTLRPVWWVLRGWLVGALVVIVLTDGSGRFVSSSEMPSRASGLAPTGLLELLVLCAAVVVSVQYGRDRWTLRGRWSAVGVLVSAGAVVALVPALVTVASAATTPEVRYEYIYDNTVPAASASLGGDQSALIAGGERVRNLFVYGPDGEYIEGAQITDQDGRPLLLTPEGSMWEVDAATGEDVSSYWVPREDVNGRQVWNAYPLGYWTSHMAEWDEEEENWFLPAGFDPWPKAPSIAKLTALKPLVPAEDPTDQTPGDEVLAPGDEPTASDAEPSATPDADPDVTPSGTPTATPSGEVAEKSKTTQGSTPIRPTKPVKTPQGTAAAR